MGTTITITITTGIRTEGSDGGDGVVVVRAVG